MWHKLCTLSPFFILCFTHYIFHPLWHSCFQNPAMMNYQILALLCSYLKCSVTGKHFRVMFPSNKHLLLPIDIQLASPKMAPRSLMKLFCSYVFIYMLSHDIVLENKFAFQPGSRDHIKILFLGLCMCLASNRYYINICWRRWVYL